MESSSVVKLDRNRPVDDDDERRYKKLYAQNMQWWKYGERAAIESYKWFEQFSPAFLSKIPPEIRRMVYSYYPELQISQTRLVNGVIRLSNSPIVDFPTAQKALLLEIVHHFYEKTMFTFNQLCDGNSIVLGSLRKFLIQSPPGMALVPRDTLRGIVYLALDGVGGYPSITEHSVDNSAGSDDESTRNDEEYDVRRNEIVLYDEDEEDDDNDTRSPLLMSDDEIERLLNALLPLFHVHNKSIRIVIELRIRLYEVNPDDSPWFAWRQYLSMLHVVVPLVYGLRQQHSGRISVMDSTIIWHDERYNAIVKPIHRDLDRPLEDVRADVDKFEEWLTGERASHVWDWITPGGLFKRIQLASPFSGEHPGWCLVALETWKDMQTQMLSST